LQWSDIDLDARTLTVRHALQRVDGELRLVEPKSKSSRRTVNLPEFAVSKLYEHRARQGRERMQHGGDWSDLNLVFTSHRGTPLDNRAVTRTFQHILAENDLPRKRFHDLRHTCATFLALQGVSARVIMETLGHSEIGLTMDTYAHVLPALQREAADRMDDLLSATPD